MSLRHNDGLDTPKPSGTPIILNGDGVSMAPTPRKKDPRYTFEKSWAPGKLASDSDIKKSAGRPLPSDPHYDPSKHMPRSAAAARESRSITTSSPTVHQVGDEAIPQLRPGDAVHFFAGEGEAAMMYHGLVRGTNDTHLVVETPDAGSWTIPRSHARPGVHPDCTKRDGK